MWMDTQFAKDVIIERELLRGFSLPFFFYYFLMHVLVLLFLVAYPQFPLLHMVLRVQLLPVAYLLMQTSLFAEQNRPLLHMTSAVHAAFALTVPGSMHTPKHNPEVQAVPKTQPLPAAFFAVQVLEAVPQ